MSPLTFHDGKVTLHHGDSRDVLKTLSDASIESIVCDPPYALVSIGKRFGADGAAPAQFGRDGAYARASAGFMGKKWDTGETAFAVEFWAEVLRVLKPGGHVVAFGGTRTYHRLACAIEDAGFEIRDQLVWAYGSGFPKSHDVSKGIDRAAGAEREILGSKTAGASSLQRVARVEQGYRDKLTSCDPSDIAITAPATEAARQWSGWGTALKPAIEPIVLARKPLQGTVAANVLAHGTGAINVDACRVGMSQADKEFIIKTARPNSAGQQHIGDVMNRPSTPTVNVHEAGRWPPNFLHDGSDKVVDCFPANAGGSGGGAFKGHNAGRYGAVGDGGNPSPSSFGDSGSAARFFPAFPLTDVDRIFYSAKADGNDRLNSKHPTVKPLDLMRWLVRLVTPKGGLVLDPFAGTGPTGHAALIEGMRAILIEREDEYVADITRRMGLVYAGQDERRGKLAKVADDHGPLFGGAA